MAICILKTSVLHQIPTYLKHLENRLPRQAYALLAMTWLFGSLYLYRQRGFGRKENSSININLTQFQIPWLEHPQGVRRICSAPSSLTAALPIPQLFTIRRSLLVPNIKFPLTQHFYSTEATTPKNRIVPVSLSRIAITKGLSSMMLMGTPL